MGKDAQNLQGTWRFTSLEVDGNAMEPSAVGESAMAIAGDTFEMKSMGFLYKGTFRIDEKSKPKTIDIHFTEGIEKGNNSLGIYQLRKDKWTICLGLTGKPRPSDFVTSPGSGHALETLERDTGEPPAKPHKRGSKSSNAAADEVATARATNMTPELQAQQGEWSMVSGMVDGQAFPPEVVAMGKRFVNGDEVRVLMGGQVIMKARVQMDATQKPKTIDYQLGDSAKGKRQLGIYECSGDEFRSCFAAPGSPRPEGFVAPPGSGRTLTAWRRKR
jgi:uncharacterized protein (TIGR03067 family)